MDSFIQVDPNMIVNTTIGDVEVVWRDVRTAPFALHGFYQPLTEEIFRRVPTDVAEATSVNVAKLSQESAGGRVRFSTDSPYVAIRAKYRVVGRSSHLTLVASSGFDLYVDGAFGSRFVKEFRMPYDMTDSYEQIVYLESAAMRSFTINFPVHAVLESLEIGLKPSARLEAPRPYRNADPVVIYGSSIVHGTAASRPGLTYPSILTRDLNIDVYNLGFSGNAKGERPMAEWIATLPMSIFVCDYDHNAPTPEYLEETHYPFYEVIREKNPDLPYVMITRPNFWTCWKDHEVIMKRREVVMRSYLKARETGDRNVYFIDGFDFWTAPHTYECSMDGIHPNDIGFVRMADNIGTVLRYIFEKQESNL
ncbi:MAG: hypothetical protein E7666_05560 [Ruminococcaceae bacterium]|nr:hypothetical protein [Oscillospiraceae bacterium]